MPPHPVSETQQLLDRIEMLLDEVRGLDRKSRNDLCRRGINEDELLSMRDVLGLPDRSVARTPRQRSTAD
jgi:hypothetical protein